MSLPPLERCTLDDLAARARTRLDPAVWEFLQGGAGDELTVAANRAAFGRWQLRPRVLSGLGPPDTATTVLGQAAASPILVAPFAGDTRFHPDGFGAVLRACAEHGTMAVVPELTAASLETLAAEVPAAARIAQVSLLGTARDFATLAGRARDAGFGALVVTADAPVVGVRRRQAPTSAAGEVFKTLGNFAAGAGVDPATYFGHAERLVRPQWSWAQLADAAAGVGLPFAVKGVLTAADARAAVEAGAVAVYVSNHGGRQIEPTVATLEALCEVVDEVGTEVEVLVDGGVRSGADVVLALALGARAVLVGRPAAVGLAAAGATGVSRVLDLLERELVTTLTLLGRGGVADLDRAALQPASR